mmetsp:Transcript_15009/g.34636  ORF Transcript_15009/g.34636 Transcript_15009/m.34636 type:complete len:326 (-) Transcript_15009:320-1297(-)
MHIFRYMPSTGFPAIWMSCASCAVGIAVFAVLSDAFATFGATAKKGFKAGINGNKYSLEHVHKKRSQTLCMVAQVPTSNVSFDDLMVADNVFVDSVDAEDIKYTDENDEEDLSTMDTLEIKTRLLDLLPRMTGTREEYNKLESYVNTLEERFVAPQTLDFLNLIMSGEWQLLFSTNLAGKMKPDFRMTELIQRVETNNFNGTVVNEATWALAQDYTGTTPATSFDAKGKFHIKCSYSINQGARMIMNLDDHQITLDKGSSVPTDFPALVGMLYRAIPTELFDPNDHAMDTTYLDGDLRIVRMTGPKFEAVRDIFIRRGSMEINPM